MCSTKNRGGGFKYGDISNIAVSPLVIITCCVPAKVLLQATGRCQDYRTSSDVRRRTIFENLSAHLLLHLPVRWSGRFLFFLV